MLSRSLPTCALPPQLGLQTSGPQDRGGRCACVLVCHDHTAPQEAGPCMLPVTQLCLRTKLVLRGLPRGHAQELTHEFLWPVSPWEHRLSSGHSTPSVHPNMQKHVCGSRVSLESRQGGYFPTFSSLLLLFCCCLALRGTWGS